MTRTALATDDEDPRERRSALARIRDNLEEARRLRPVVPGSMTPGSLRWPRCNFYRDPTEAERTEMQIPDGVTIGCENTQAEGPLYFYVPVEGGAVRVGVCQEHCDWLMLHHGIDR
jgi:hypothetical protein